MYQQAPVTCFHADTASFALVLVFDKVPAGLNKPRLSPVIHIYYSLISNSFVFFSVKLFLMNKKRL